MGANINNIISTDPNPAADLLDVQDDIKTIASKDPAVNWGWYQQGFNANDEADPDEPQGTGTPNPNTMRGGGSVSVPSNSACLEDHQCDACLMAAFSPAF